jgi:DNA-binding Lrp family transcriptional regulator
VLNGYVLIQAEVGMARNVGDALGAVDGVTQVDMVTGPYDVIARTQASDFEQLGALMNRIQTVDGVARTLTCSVLHL